MAPGPHSSSNRRPGRAAAALSHALAALLAGAAQVACTPQPEASIAPLAPLLVEFAGCAAVRAGPVCELSGPGQLTLWLEAAEDATISVRVDGKEATLSRATVAGGVQLHVSIGAPARVLTVGVSHRTEERRFRLPLAHAEPLAELDEAEALRNKGQLDEAEARLAGPLHHLSPDVRARARGKLARIERTRGRAEEAVRQFHEAIALDREAGRRSDEIKDRLALSFTLVAQRRFTEARAAGEPLSALGAEDPAGGALTPYYAGQIAYETGDLRAARSLLRQADAATERLALDEHRASALELEAEVLRLLGRPDEVPELFRAARALLGPNVPACRHAAYLSNLGWFLLHMAEQAEPAEPSAPVFEQAIALYRADCAVPALLANALTNLAHARLANGENERAQALVDEARRALPKAEAVLEAAWIELEGRLALARRDAPRALAQYEHLGALAAQALIPDARWRAALGRATALEALGRDRDARDAYAEAEDLLDEDSRRVPLGEGKTTFLGQREESARRRVDFLLRRRDPGAASAARRSRVRVLAELSWSHRIHALDEAGRARWEETLAAYRRGRDALDAGTEADWTLPADQLVASRAERSARAARLRAALDQGLAGLWPDHAEAQASDGKALASPGESEVFLVFHPLPQGVVGFALTRRGSASRRLGPVDPDASPADLAERLLAPFRAELSAATRLRVLSFGALTRVDFHALPFDGGPLAARLIVSYGLDLPARIEPPGAAVTASALVIADPRGDLAGARDEARRIVETRSAQAGFTTRVLRGREATHRAVRDAIEDPRFGLLHFSGHGIFEGRDGWESGLLLAAGGQLSVSDILVLRRVPDFVLLSGCETAQTSPGVGAIGLGLAQAFLIAGSRAVVATSRPVDDALAERVMTALHLALGESPGIDLAASLRDAQLAVRRETPAADWAAFRALVP